MRYLTMATRLVSTPTAPSPRATATMSGAGSCDQLGSVFILRGQLDAEGGHRQTAIDGLCQVGGREDPRTGSQRRADALVSLAARASRTAPFPPSTGSGRTSL